MTYIKRPTCHRCKCSIRKYESWDNLLMPFPDGQVLRVTMHGRCIEAWNKLATTQLYSDLFEKKRKAHLRTQGVYVA